MSNDAGGRTRRHLSKRGLVSSPQPDWFGPVQHFIDLLEASDACELRIEASPLRLGLWRSAPRPVSLAKARPAPPPPSHFHQIRAPLTGIWYDSPSPTAPSYVQIGSLVDVGTVVGLVETMKIFNEITADVSGQVVEVYARRGDLVAAHTPLLSLDPTQGARWLPPE